MNVLMEYIVDFTLEFLPIRQTTLKSESIIYCIALQSMLNQKFRVLLATIRNLGSFPCPRCLIPKEKIPEVGTKNDDRRRERDQRVANDNLFSDIKLARTWIYNEGLLVKSAAVERLLSPTSLVPTLVCLESTTPFTRL